MSALDRLTAFFKGDTEAAAPRPLPPTDVPHVLAALLVRMAKVDNHYAVQEISQIDRILGNFLEIGPIDAAKLRGEGERLEAFAPDTDDFTQIICRSVDYDRRLALTKALWEVVYSDGATKQSEIDAMSVTQEHLGIKPDDCEGARHDAKETLER